MAPTRLVYVVGAGITGLTLALALAKFGLRVIVLERNTTFETGGAGLQISPNARKILDRIGLSQALTEQAFEPDGIDVWPQRRLRPIQTLALGQTVRERFGAPYAVMHRGDLGQALFRAARRFANIDIRFGVESVGWDAEGAGVRVRYTEAGQPSVSAPAWAIVGTDGVNSVLRDSLTGTTPAAESGAMAWRALTDPDALGNGLRLDRTSLLLAPGHHMVIYPLPARNQVNLVLLDARAAGHDAPEAMPAPSDHKIMDTLLRRVTGWTPWSIRTHRTHHYGQGPVALAGDAAHAMLPFAAQGAAMGIEDAATLATLLATAPNAAHATQRYRDLRAGRVRKVAELSRKNGQIFHMGWPAMHARDTVLALGGSKAHLARQNWVYGYEIAGGTAILGPKPPDRTSS